MRSLERDAGVSVFTVEHATVHLVGRNEKLTVELFRTAHIG